jgi:hypothetical protein
VQELRSERSALEKEIDRLSRAISALEGGTGRGRSSGARKPAATGRRRRAMSAAARKAVSQRMKKYWAARRKAAA